MLLMPHYNDAPAVVQAIPPTAVEHACQADGAKNARKRPHFGIDNGSSASIEGIVGSRENKKYRDGEQRLLGKTPKKGHLVSVDNGLYLGKLHRGPLAYIYGAVAQPNQSRLIDCFFAAQLKDDVIAHIVPNALGGARFFQEQKGLHK